MVEGLQKIVEPLHISEDPTQKMVGGKMIFINFILEPYSIKGRGLTLFGAGCTYSKIFNNSVMFKKEKHINMSQKSFLNFELYYHSQKKIFF